MKTVAATPLKTRERLSTISRGPVPLGSLILALFLLAPLRSFGQEIVEEIAPPPALSDEEVMEPEVTIIRRKDKTVEEYRMNGRLYMVKVTPTAGPPYYLVDNDGDGLFDQQMGDIYNDFKVPKWVIFSW